MAVKVTKQSDTYTCEKHNLAGLSSWCPSCIAEFNGRMPACEMSISQRIVAFKALPEQLTIPFDSLHLWITELMGRDVWTHELAHPEQLIEELESGESADIGDVMGKLPWDKPVVLVDPAGHVEQI